VKIDDSMIHSYFEKFFNSPDEIYFIFFSKGQTLVQKFPISSAQIWEKEEAATILFFGWFFLLI
jgi:hypothetical protein